MDSACIWAQAIGIGVDYIKIFRIAVTILFAIIFIGIVAFLVYQSSLPSLEIKELEYFTNDDIRTIENEFDIKLPRNSNISYLSYVKNNTLYGYGNITVELICSGLSLLEIVEKNGTFRVEENSSFMIIGKNQYETRVWISEKNGTIILTEHTISTKEFEELMNSLKVKILN